MPLVALAISPVKAAAIVLPILIVQDWVSVWAFRRDWDLRNLAILAPAGAIGVAAGWLMAARVDEQAVRLAVGLISVGFVAFMLLRDRLASAAATERRSRPACSGAPSPASPASSAIPARRRRWSTCCRRG